MPEPNEEMLREFFKPKMPKKLKRSLRYKWLKSHKQNIKTKDAEG